MKLIFELTVEEVKEAVAEYVQGRNPRTLGKRRVAPTNVDFSGESKVRVILPDGVEKDHIDPT